MTDKPQGRRPRQDRSRQGHFHPLPGTYLSTNDYRHIAGCEFCQAAHGARVAAIARDVADAGRDVQPSAPDPIAEARERGRQDALDELRGALQWQRAALFMHLEWIGQDRAARDPSDRRELRLLDQLDGLRLATDELFYQQFPGSWDRERVRMREQFERGEL